MHFSALYMITATPMVLAETSAQQNPHHPHEHHSSESQELSFQTMVVTATGEAKALGEVAESISVMDRETIQQVSPSHPSELLNRSAGVHVNNLGGEGHMTAIRQPITTGGVYLFLEDGLPTRPTGMFNHNGLYEINVPQADRVEVIKGPGSALYGSDSIGGIINVITQASPDEPEFSVNTELGGHGWQRALISAGAPISDDAGLRIDTNLTENDGYRDNGDYSRRSFTARLDNWVSDDTAVKTVLSYTKVDQSGVSGLEEDDYQHHPTTNFYGGDIGGRTVEALRLSSEFTYQPDNNNRFTFTPYYRDNTMAMMPSWMIGYDANVNEREFQSFGFLLKHRKRMGDGVEVVTGVDVDYTPSSFVEERIQPTTDGDYVTGYSKTGRTNYNYDADQLSISPYVHSEWQMTEKLRWTAGLRYDYFHVDYQDNLDGSVAQSGFDYRGYSHLRPESQTISYDHFSPKLGAIYALSENQDLYANYRHSFRVPSIGSLFRSGSSLGTTDLEPVETDSVEIGTRGVFANGWAYEAAIYHMVVRNDIVTYIDDVTSDRKVTNAGETQHQGIELSLAGALSDHWRFSAAWTLTNQEYNDYSAVYGFPSTEINYAGNDVGKAPKTMGNLAVEWLPAFSPDSRIELEWEHIGEYFTDETNDNRYNGHDLLNLRAAHQLNEHVQFYGRVMNLTDRRYSTYTSNQVGDSDLSYRPGLPRTLYVGVNVQF